MSSRQTKAKKPSNQEARRTTEGRRRNRDHHHLKDLLQTQLEEGNQKIHALYVMRIIGHKFVHTELKLKNSLRIRKLLQC